MKIGEARNLKGRVYFWFLKRRLKKVFIEQIWDSSDSIDHLLVKLTYDSMYNLVSVWAKRKILVVTPTSLLSRPINESGNLPPLMVDGEGRVRIYDSKE